MYLAHFGLHELPFGLTPDTAFAFGTRAHQEALNTLLVAVSGGEGFIKITGEVGTGKTLLCRRFLATLPADVVSCYLPNPNHTPRSLLLALAEELGHTLSADGDEFVLLKKINDTLLHLAAEGRRVVVCLDEAQALKTESLETLRLLSNLETEKRKLLQVVLFGQPELDARLARAELRQLRQRISFHDRLGVLSREELRLYLDHRLRVAGWRGAELFSRGAVATLHRASGGTPRLVNIVAHKALLAVYGAGGALVERRHVREAARDTEDSSPAGWRRWRWMLR
ncbi:MAG TPA: AAA family ATPase [Albitalea sp.]|uniref:ExeA family protein n=1 Tax=Piscinibacter sp. TaxID=1903157 RepID=UPI002ED3A86B